MSKARRIPLADLLGQDEDTSSRDHVTEPRNEPEAATIKRITEPAAVRKATAKPTIKTAKQAATEPKELRRNSYHASLYLPEEAQFALREIALTMRRAKPHDVMLEAMAEMFEKYNKGKLARECRARIATKG